MKSDFNWLTVIDVLLHQAPWTWLQGLNDATHHSGSRPVEIYEPCSHKGIMSNDNLDSFNVCPHLPVACPFFPIWLLRDEGKHWKTNSRTRTRTSVLWVVSLLFASSSLLSKPPPDSSPVIDVYHRLWYLRTDEHVQARTEGFPLFWNLY